MNILVAAAAIAAMGSHVAAPACPIYAEILNADPIVIALDAAGMKAMCGGFEHGGPDSQMIYCKDGTTVFVFKADMEPNACLVPKTNTPEPVTSVG